MKGYAWTGRDCDWPKIETVVLFGPWIVFLARRVMDVKWYYCGIGGDGQLMVIGGGVYS